MLVEENYYDKFGQADKFQAGDIDICFPIENHRYSGNWM